MDCQNSGIKGTSSYRNGCRCLRCVTEMRGAATLYNTVQKQRRVKYRELNREKTKRYAKIYKLRSKIDAFLAYGGIICRCCKEENIKFLTLDHIFNDGFLSRPLVGGRRIYREDYRTLRAAGFPNKERYQVLCMNCNFGKRLNNGVCPHEDLK